MKLYDLLIRSANAFLAVQTDDGGLPAGHNGPYYDEELPVRNTAHGLMVFLKAHQISDDKKYLDAGRKALKHVLDIRYRPMGATFWCRNKPQKDFSNGLIGQAWIIDALICGDKVFPEYNARQIARDVFLLHPFIDQKGVWKIVNVDGSHAGVDPTFNHQLWFAAIGSLFVGEEQIKSQVKRFLQRLDVNLGLYDNGLIVHRLEPKIPFKQRIRDRICFYCGRAAGNIVINKAVGYHAFNTYGFALMYPSTSSHSFWQSERFNKILRFLEDPLFIEGHNCFADYVPAKQGLTFNKFGYSYNPPGIEVAYTMEVFQNRFSGVDQKVKQWLKRQVDETFDLEQGLMNRQTEDPWTLAARICEATRLSDQTIG